MNNNSILMIAPEPYFEPRGTPISIYFRCLALTKIGYQVDLLTYSIGEDKSMPGLNIYRIPRIPFINKIKIGPSFVKLFLDCFLMFYGLIRLFKFKYL